MIVPQDGMIANRKGNPDPEAAMGPDGAHQCLIPRKKNREAPNGVPRQSSLLIYEMATAVLLPASFVAFRAEGFFLAVADGLDPSGADTGRGQCAFDCTSALVAQSQVVLGRAAFVAMSLNCEIHVGV